MLTDSFWGEEEHQIWKTEGEEQNEAGRVSGCEERHSFDKSLPESALPKLSHKEQFPHGSIYREHFYVLLILHNTPHERTIKSRVKS